MICALDRRGAPSTRMKIVPLALTLLSLGLLGCGEREPPVRSNILLVTLDTLRADHLSAYGYSRQTSPVIDRLAAAGVRFDQATVQWPKTGPSFASIFSATYPKNNGIVRKVGIPLPRELLLLAEVLRRQGYGTHAVVANGAVASDFHFDQGFDTYIETWKLEAPDGAVDPSSAEGVTGLAKAVLESVDRDRPYFLWVHYIDPHFPYTPPGEWSDRFQDDEFFEAGRRLEIDRSRPKHDLVRLGAEQVLDGRDDLGFYVARYDAEIAYNDAQLGDLLEHMERQGLLEDTLTVVTSDHGESLGEHHYLFDHGRFGFQTCLRVPLIFHYPGVLEPRVDPHPVELIHITPTLLEMAGVELEDGIWMQGRSLWPRLFAEEQRQGSRYVFSEAGYGRPGMWQRIVREPRFKLVDALEGGAQRWITLEVGQRYALYDLDNDPDETDNVVGRFPDEAERLKRVLTAWYESGFDPLVDEPGEDEPRRMDPETEEQLRALGYLQ